MVLTRGSALWARRGILAVVLVGAALIPGRARSLPAAHCTGQSCHPVTAKISWKRPLPGRWTAQSGALGTVLSKGQAYAAAGGGVAAVGFGVSVVAYRLATGAPLWTMALAGFPPQSAIVSVRAWDNVVTAGVSVPATRGRAAHREEIVLSAATGARIRDYPAAAYGGAVWASAARTVVVGPRAVTSYVNATGKVAWQVRTGAVAQAWRVARDDLFVAISRDGYLGTAPVTALRQIDLRTGAQKILRPAGGPFAGTLSAAIGGAVLFSGPAGISAYSGTDGRLLWHRPGVVPEAADAVRQTIYVTSGKALIGINPSTDAVVTRASTPGAAGLYAVSNGVALGLDQGALGDVWGYDLATKQVIWTVKAVPWPHFFVDLSGIGGSASPAGGTIVLASCAQPGAASSSGSAPPCLRPQLVAIKS
ncbi:MAG TPA: PQQ-binding-like beta-propeller repeat protein [Streptosporangiaceae bacterium]|nr:PQQ-binding-like beta-propeller repeat protein [Streptosporangiaceae bacterium]